MTSKQTTTLPAGNIYTFKIRIHGNQLASLKRTRSSTGLYHCIFPNNSAPRSFLRVREQCKSTLTHESGQEGIQVAELPPNSPLPQARSAFFPDTIITHSTDPCPVLPSPHLPTGTCIVLPGAAASITINTCCFQWQLGHALWQKHVCDSHKVC